MTNEDAIQYLAKLRDSFLDVYANYEADVMDYAISALERDRWISVEERLPGYIEYVLCCGSKGGQFIGRVSHSAEGKKAWAFQPGGNGRRITHWKPLPEPPKEET